MAARSVLLSSQYNRTGTGGVSNVAHASGGGRFHLPEYPVAGRPHLKASTLPEILRDAGYHTAAIGKWHLHSWPHDVGFDEYVIPRVHHCHTSQSFTENGGPEFTPDGYSVDFESARVLRFLQRHRKDETPFFLYYNISPPHCPVADSPEAYRTRYSPDEISLRPNVDIDRRLEGQDHHFKVYRWDFRYYDHHLPYTEQLPDGYTLRNLIAEYYGLITWMDDTLGKMLRTLDQTRLAENTVVVFTSDHGDNLGSHGLVQKGTLNEESIRVPLMLRYPASFPKPSLHTDRVASLVDIAPMLLTLADAPVPDHFHGRSLLTASHPQSDPANLAAFVETDAGPAIRTLTHLYHLPYLPNSRTLAERPAQFFDLENDPYQLNNLAESTLSDETVLSGLDRALRAWDRATPWMKERKGSG